MSDHIAPFPWYDVLLLLALVALNGVLAMGELAIVSSRDARLKAMAKGGNRGAECALSLAADPGRFLSTVQSGITLIAIFAGAFSGEKLGQPTADRLAFLGLNPDTARTVGFTVVIVLTTFVSLVVGEIVPKQIALRSPEPIAVVLARPMRWLSIGVAPFVWVLNKSSELIFKLLGLDRESKNQVTAEELHLVVAEAQTAGVLEESERAIISGIVRLADRPVREVMTPRTDVDWIDVGASPEEIRQELLDNPHSRIPVADGSIENIVGVIQTRDVLAANIRGEPLDLKRLCRKAPVIRRDRNARQHSRGPCGDLRSRRRTWRGAATDRARGWQLAGIWRGKRRSFARPAWGQSAPGAGLFDGRRLCLVGAEAFARHWRDLPARRLAVRDHRHRRP
jgi:putative hemolysin